MSDTKTITFSGDDIIQALLPEIKRRLAGDARHWTVTETCWETRPLPPTRRPDRALRPGCVPMTVDVEFTLTRVAETEPS